MPNVNTSYEVRPDKHTLAQINELNPEEGVVVFDTDSKVNRYWNGTDWVGAPSATNFIFINTKTDLPTASAGVITLEANKTYYFTTDIDLLGDRLVGSQNTTILGSSSENSSITSTGLSASEYLFYTDFTTPIRHITFKDHDLGVGVNVSNSGAQPIALDWYGVNFNNLGTSLVCGDIDNIILTVCAILNGGSIVFIGSVGTIGVNSSIFVGDGAAEPLIQVTSAATIIRRFRVTYSAFVASGSTEAIDVEVGATVPTEGFILDTCNFSGGGVYLPSLDHTSNEALFSNNVGITNSADISQYYMVTNLTTTPVALQGTAYKIEGVTTSASVTSKFTNTDNRATYIGSLDKFFKVTATLSCNSGTNNEIGIYVAKNGVILPESEVYITANSGGRAEAGTVQALVRLTQNDYIEIFVENETTAQDITVTDLNVIIE